MILLQLVDKNGDNARPVMVNPRSIVMASANPDKPELTMIGLDNGQVALCVVKFEEFTKYFDAIQVPLVKKAPIVPGLVP